MIGYKVVKRCGSGFRSVYSPSPLDYSLGHMTKPDSGHGPLAVFSSLEDARIWLFDVRESSFGYAYSILECEYEPSNQCSMWIIPSINICGIIYKINLNYCPHGTVLANWVKPIKEISL